MNEQQVAKWWGWGPVSVEWDLDRAQRDWSERYEKWTFEQLRYDFVGVEDVPRAEAALVAIDAMLEMVGRAEPPPAYLVNQVFYLG